MDTNAEKANCLCDTGKQRAAWNLERILQAAFLGH